MREGLTSRGRSHPGLLPLANLRFEGSRLLPAGSSEPDVAPAVRALKQKLLPDPRHEFRPSNPRRVVRAWLERRVIRVAAAFRGVTADPVPAGRGLAPLADVADRQRRDGPPQLVIRRKHPVVAMPVLPRRRDEIGEPVQEPETTGPVTSKNSWPRRRTTTPSRSASGSGRRGHSLPSGGGRSRTPRGTQPRPIWQPCGPPAQRTARRSLRPHPRNTAWLLEAGSGVLVHSLNAVRFICGEQTRFLDTPSGRCAARG